MISEINDKEILDFLMNSEFEGDFKPSELKYFLFKWRYFYRLLHGKYETNKNEIESLKNKNNEILLKNNEHIEKLKNVILKQERIIKNLKNRKLSIYERLTGKIIYKNENK